MKRPAIILVVALCTATVGVAYSQDEAPAPAPMMDAGVATEAPTAPELPAEEATAPTEEATAPEAGDASGEAADKPAEAVNPAEENPTAFSKDVWGKFQSKEWGAAFIGLLILLITLFRAGATRISGWFKSKAGGYVLNFGTTFALGILLALWAGVGWNIGLIPTALTGAMAVSGGRKGLKDFIAWYRSRGKTA